MIAIRQMVAIQMYAVELVAKSDRLGLLIGLESDAVQASKSNPFLAVRRRSDLSRLREFA